MVELSVILREQEVLALLMAKGSGVGGSGELSARHSLSKVVGVVEEGKRAVLCE